MILLVETDYEMALRLNSLTMVIKIVFFVHNELVPETLSHKVIHMYLQLLSNSC